MHAVWTAGQNVKPMQLRVYSIVALTKKYYYAEHAQPCRHPAELRKLATPLVSSAIISTHELDSATESRDLGATR